MWPEPDASVNVAVKVFVAQAFLKAGYRSVKCGSRIGRDKAVPSKNMLENCEDLEVLNLGRQG